MTPSPFFRPHPASHSTETEAEHDVCAELCRLIEQMPEEAPLQQAYVAGRLRQELPDTVLLAAVRDLLRPATKTQ